MSTDNSIVEANIGELSKALSLGQTSAVDLVAKYLIRIAKYDCKGPYPLNSIPLINLKVFDEAGAADDRRLTNQSLGPLDGIPYTVKDSYKVNDMTVASGSEAFQNLVANEDAFVVGALRSAGAVLIGKTNMCPMAYGGMLRGLYGRAESPYNPEYLPAAFGSGSSNGSGVATGASFAAFGMGEETVSSGRSPASNNSLVAYTPSRGLISIRGNWPLYPTCDVIVPHTRSTDDLLYLLDIIAGHDHTTAGDFWRDQPFMSIPKPWSDRSKSFHAIKDHDHLKGKRVAVPKMYLEQIPGGPYVSASILPLWNQAKSALESAGATIEVTDGFPAIEAYENPPALETAATRSPPRLPENWNATERGSLIANAWEDFLSLNKSTSIPSLAIVDPKRIFPHMSRSDPQVKFTEPANAINWSALREYVADRPSRSSKYPDKSSLYDIPNLEEAVKSLEAMRKHYFEDWMTAHGYDFVAFPAVGDVAKSNADINEGSAEHAWRNGVKYSHGNRALRHLGIPSVTVPMGSLQDSDMPIGLTILGRAYEDTSILKAGYVFEQQRNGRVCPVLTPTLPSDTIADERNTLSSNPRPAIEISKCEVTASTKTSLEGLLDVNIEGRVGFSQSHSSSSLTPKIDIYIDGNLVPPSTIRITLCDTSSNYKQVNGQNDMETKFYDFSAIASTLSRSQKPSDGSRAVVPVVGKIARDSTMIMVLARPVFASGNAEGSLQGHTEAINGTGSTNASKKMVSGRPSGCIRLIHESEILQAT